MATNLTSLTNVKSWGAISSSNDDVLLTRLIAQASRAIYAYLTTNTLFLQTFSQSYDGVNNSRLILKEWPVISIASLYINGSNVNACPAQPQQGAGYKLEQYNGIPPGQPQALDLIGRVFCKGQQNIYITYNIGYAVTNEAHNIPSSIAYTITVNQIYGNFGQDDGVVSAAGIVFVNVASSPGVGQYSVNATTGVYTFNVADANRAMLISYSYIPADIEQACIEMIIERYTYKQRIGQKTKSLGGQETASYDLSAMSEYVKMLLQPYKRTNII